MNVVIVSASWCTKCSPTKKVLTELSEEYGFNLEVLDADSNPEKVRDLGVRGLPTILMYKENYLTPSMIVGGKTKSELEVALGLGL